MTELIPVNKKVFSFAFISSVSVVSLISTGNSFHASRPATENEFSGETSLVHGTNKICSLSMSV